METNQLVFADETKAKRFSSPALSQLGAGIRLQTPALTIPSPSAYSRMTRLSLSEQQYASI